MAKISRRQNLRSPIRPGRWLRNTRTTCARLSRSCSRRPI